MGAGESTESGRERQAGAQQEQDKENEGSSFFSKAVAAVTMAGAAAVLVGGAVAVLSKSATERLNEMEQSEKWPQLGSSSTTQKCELQMISWKAPINGWMKINTDGAARPGAAAAGGLIRDSKGQWSKGFTYNIGHETTPTVAELWGLIKGIELAWNEGFKKVILETDNEGVVNMIKNTRNRQNDNYELVRVIRQWLERDWQVEVTYCEREGNRCADWLANLGIKGPVGYHELIHPPQGLLSRLEEDC